MANFETTAFIACSPQTVFEYITDPAKFSSWQASTVSAAWTSEGTPGQGSTYTVESKSPRGTMETKIEITVWDSPKRFGFKSGVLSFPFKGIAGETTLTPIDNGTQMTLQGQIKLIGILKPLEALFVKLVRKQDAGNILNLKQLLEAGA